MNLVVINKQEQFGDYYKTNGYVIEGDLKVNCEIKLLDDLTVKGNLILDRWAEIAGAVNVHGNIKSKSMLYVHKGIWVNGSISASELVSVSWCSADSIKTSGSLRSFYEIKTNKDIISDSRVNVLYTIQSEYGSIKAKKGIEAGMSIYAGKDIIVGKKYGIKSGLGISAGGKIVCGRCFAGTICTVKSVDDTIKDIQCNSFVGKVEYGILEIETREENLNE